MKNVQRNILLICSSLLFIFIIGYLLIAMYVASEAEKDTRKKADAILVLGARSYIGGNYNSCLKARVDHAVELYKDGYAHKILMTGGYDTEDNSNEADTMRKIAMEKGITTKDILLERAATSTYENFSFSKEILKKNHLSSVIVVTEPYHIARASLVAEKLGYTFSVSPAKNSLCWLPDKYVTKYFLKEPIAIAAYKIENKL